MDGNFDVDYIERKIAEIGEDDLGMDQLIQYALKNNEEQPRTLKKMANAKLEQLYDLDELPLVIENVKKQYTSAIALKEGRLVNPDKTDIKEHNSKKAGTNQIHIVPSNSELKDIQTNEKLSNDMKDELCRLHTTDMNLKKLIIQEMEVVERLAKEVILSGKSFDFGWKEYTLRDVVVKQCDNVFDFQQNLRMLGLDDDESSNILYPMVDNNLCSNYMTVLLYYGAPSDTDEIYSGIRFIDVISVDAESQLQRESFLRYSKRM